MRWFGESWGAPVCDPDNHDPTPVGVVCMGCGNEIESGDWGFKVPHHVPELGAAVSPVVRPWHKDCFLRTVLGPLEHARSGPPEETPDDDPTDGSDEDRDDRSERERRGRPV